MTSPTRAGTKPANSELTGAAARRNEKKPKESPKEHRDLKRWAGHASHNWRYGEGQEIKSLLEFAMRSAFRREISEFFRSFLQLLSLRRPPDAICWPAS